MTELTSQDVLRLYAKLNAQDHLITACFGGILGLAPDPENLLEQLRLATIDLADRQKPENPSEFAQEGMVLTLQMVAEKFAELKASTIRQDGGAE